MRSNFLLAMFLTLSLLGGSGYAVTLVAIELPLPADGGAIRAKCAQAFQQALADKEAYENRPEVNLQCAFNMNGKIMKGLDDRFMSTCEEVVAAEARLSTERSVVVSSRILATGFDNLYAIIFRRDCLDKAVSAFHVDSARGRASSGGRAAVREGGCHAFLGCE